MMREITLKELKRLALESKTELWQQAKGLGRDVKLYLHWTAGHYGQFFEEYHINIDFDGKIYVSNDDLADIKGHTYMRNTGSIGVTLCCCMGATIRNLGDEAPTKAQIESLARAVTVLADALDLTIDIERVMTHGEAADNEDGIYPAYEYNGFDRGMYGPRHSCERWDLAILNTGDAWCSGGSILRGKANWFRSEYMDGVENYF